MEILQIVLLQLELTESNPAIDLAVAKVRQQVKNYCNIEEIPPELNFTVADMVVDVLGQEDGENFAVKKVDMGDTSYTFADASAIDTVMSDYRLALQQFRKLR